MKDHEICKKIMEECLARFKNENINVSEISACLCGYLVAIVSEYHPDEDCGEKWLLDLVKEMFEMKDEAREDD